MTTALNKKLKLQPLSDRVIVQRVKEEEKIAGGIILPDSAKQKQDMGEVLAVGPGKRTNEGKLIEIAVKVGDKILWDKYAGQEVSIDDEEYVLVKADDIIAIVE